MAARLTLARANVTTPTASHERVRLLVSNGQASLRASSGLVLDEMAVTEVRSLSRRMWELVGDEGVWSVTKAPCGCGSR
jgi:hypothetical protein